MTRLIIGCLLLAACGEDPISFSAPVGINLKAKSGDVSGTVISDEKTITTESGNPYGAFINDANGALGRDPGAIEIDALTLTLGANSTGVTSLADVFTGDVDTAFLINDTNNTYDVGHVVNPTGLGPVDVSITFESSAVSDIDYAKLLNGSFKVIIRGTAAPDFTTKGAEADLQLTFTFAAFE
jgi:hypothetical protein